MRHRLLAVLVLTACGGAPARDAPAPRAAPTCASTAGRVGDVLASKFEPRPPDEVVNEIIGVFRASCEQDGWSAAALACFSDAGTFDALKACEPTLTDAQQAGLVRRQSEADALGGQLRPGPAPVEAAPPPPPPPRAVPDPCDGGE